MKYITIIPFIIYLSLISGCTSHSNQKVEDNKESKFKDTSEMVKEKLIKDTAIIQSDAINIISTKVSNKTYDKDSIDKKQYNIAYKGKNNVMKVMDIFKNIHYLPLETKESSLLDFNIKKIICKNNYIYIKDVKSSGPEIHLFNKEGKFIRDVGKKGEGPEEYISCFMISINDNGWISLTDRGSSSIITYDSDGNFISKIPIKTSLYDVVYLNDSLLLHKGHYNYDGDKFYVINMYKGEIVNSFYPNKFRMYQPYLGENLTACNGRVIVAEYTNNEIWEVTKDGYKVRYIINVNDKMPPKGFWDQKVKSFTELTTEETTKGYISHIPCFTENERMMFLYFRGSLGKAETEGWALIDKETRKYQTFKRIALSDKLIISPDFFYTQSDGRFTFILSPEEILNSGDEVFISQFPGLKEDDNPILMFAELK